MAKTLEELLAEYQTAKGYTPLTQEQMQQQAANRYASVYDQKRLSANQAFQTSDQALANQLSGLQGTYDKQREDAAESFRLNYSAADRQALKRGMQRSSYNSALLANINLEGQEAQQDINDAQAEKEGALNAQRTLAAQQLADQLARYDAAQKADELAYMDELAAREYDRGLAANATANDLAIAIYNAQMQKEQFEYQKQQDALAQQNWEREFELKKSKSSGSSSGSRSASAATGTKSTLDQTLQDMMAILNAGQQTQQPSTSQTYIPTSMALAAGAYNYNQAKQKASTVGAVTPTGTKPGKRETIGAVDVYGKKDSRTKEKK